MDPTARPRAAGPCTTPAADLIVVSGPPGAGKSTVAQLLVQDFARSALVRGDDFFGSVRGGLIAPWLPAAREQNQVVLQAAAAAAGRFAAGGYTVVFDGVLGPWFLPLFAAGSGLSALSYVVLLPSAGSCVARVAGRTGHGFTDADATRAMHRAFAEADVDARHVLTGVDGPPSTVAAAVRERWDRGSLRYER